MCIVRTKVGMKTCVYEHLPFMVKVRRLHREFFHAFEWNLCLPRHCDEGEKDGDDGLLVHNRFVFYPCKVMAIIWYAQGKGEKTAKGGVA